MLVRSDDTRGGWHTQKINPIDTAIAPARRLLSRAEDRLLRVHVVHQGIRQGDHIDLGREDIVHKDREIVEEGVGSGIARQTGSVIEGESRSIAVSDRSTARGSG